MGIACFHSDFMVCEVANEANVETADSSTWRHNRLQMLVYWEKYKVLEEHCGSGTIWGDDLSGRDPSDSSTYWADPVDSAGKWVVCEAASSTPYSGLLFAPLVALEVPNTILNASSPIWARAVSGDFALQGSFEHILETFLSVQLVISESLE